MRSEAGAVCAVVPDASRLSVMAVPSGREVHYLDCGDGTLRAPGRVHRLTAKLPIGQIHDCRPADRSEHIRRTLELLNAEHGFAEIHFPLLGGLAFRTLQAKQAGLAFENTAIVVHPDDTSRAQREAKQSWPATPDDLVLDFMEESTLAGDALLHLAPGSAGERSASKPQLAASTPGEGVHCGTLESTPSPAAMMHSHHRGDLSPTKPGERCGEPLVTVGIAHYNLGRYLPDALASLTEQAHPHLEVIVVDDGSTQAESIAAVETLEKRYPRFRFLRQANAGIGATRNRLLAAATGEFFIPMDADNIAKPEMVSTFVRAMDRNPNLSAMTCYFLAFNDESGPAESLYGYRPTGGPHVLSCIRNVYGDANGIFRTADFRAIGGYETDRGTSCEDWEAYVKLIHAGKRIGVVPEYLFHYRHREAGFSRATNWFANHQRVLRQFQDGHSAALLGFQQESERLRQLLRSRRHRLADAIHSGIAAPWRWLKRQAG